MTNHCILQVIIARISSVNIYILHNFKVTRNTNTHGFKIGSSSTALFNTLLQGNISYTGQLQVVIIVGGKYIQQTSGILEIDSENRL